MNSDNFNTVSNNENGKIKKKDKSEDMPFNWKN